MARVQNLFRALKKRLSMEELREARVLADFGLEGCAHAQPGGKRQVLLVDRETLEAMELQAGVLRENITTDGLNVNSLEIGQLLRIGEARFEVSAVHPLRSDGENPPGTSARTLGAARNVVPRAGRRPHPPRRSHRKDSLIGCHRQFSHLHDPGVRPEWPTAKRQEKADSSGKHRPRNDT